MAQEEIKLIGSFKDDITPQLKKLTKQIDSIGRSFEKFNRHLRPISREFGRMAASANTFNESLKTQRSLLGANARAMGEYKKQAGKMSGAMRTMQTQQAKMMRAQGLSRSQQRSGSATVVPTAGGGKAFGASAGASFKQSIGATAIGTSIGMMASQAIMSGVSSLGRLAAAPFKKFGDMFSERIGDEMDDIKSAGGMFALDMDLTQQSGNERFFKNYNEALRFQEKLNIDMAESAASLPGVTSQYVSTSRQLTDSIQMVMDKDREGFAEFAKGLGADVTAGGVEASKAAFQTVLQKQTEQVMLMSQGQTGGLPMHIALQQLLNKEAKGGKIGMQAFTNKYRAAFQKNPMLKNMLMRAEEEMAKTEAGSVDRLKSIMDVFQKALPKEQINKMRGSLSGMMEGLRSGLLDPQAGLFGMSRASIGDAGHGVDEQGRMLKKNVDDFGNVLFRVGDELKVSADLEAKLKKIGIDKKVGDSLKGFEFTAEQLDTLGLKVGQYGIDISKSTTYVFEQIRETIAGFGPPLLEFVGFLPHLFDPFTKITEVFNQEGGFRDKANKFIAGFNKYIDALDDVANKYVSSADIDIQASGNILKGQTRTRAAFTAVTDLLKGFSSDGKLNKELEAINKRMADTSFEGIKNFDPISDAKFLLNALLNSDFMADIGEMIGSIMGGITRAVFDMVLGIFGFVTEGSGANKLMEGFTAGFGNMFKDLGMSGVLDGINKVLVGTFAKIGELIITQGLPLIIKGFISAFFAGLKSGPIGLLVSGAILMGAVKAVGFMTTASMSAATSLQLAAASAKQFAAGAMSKKLAYGPQTAATSKGVAAKATMGKLKNFFFGGLKGVKGKGMLDGSRSAMAGYRGTGGVMGKLGAGLQNFKAGTGLKQLFGAGLKSGVKLGALGGIISAGSALADGKGATEALATGLAAAGGSAIGAAIGTVIFPGIGTAIGAWIGGMIASTDAIILPLRNAIDAVIGTLGPTLGFITQVGRDIIGLFNGLIVGISGLLGPLGGVGEGFNLLHAIVFAVLSPFKLLQIAVLGVYEAYLAIKKNIPGLGLNDEEKARLEEVRTGRQRATDEFTIEGRQASGFSLTQQKQDEYNKWAEAKAKGDQDAMNASARYMKVIEAKIAAQGGGTSPTTPTTTTTTTTTTAPTTTAVTNPVATPVAEFPTEAITKPIEDLKVPLEETKTTMQELKAELPPAIDTSIKAGIEPAVTSMASVETTVSTAASEIVSALSHGQKIEVFATTPLPVRMDGMAALLASKKVAGPGYKGFFPMYAGNVFSAAGGMNLGKAISTEIKNKPPGSDLVIANSSETIIPAGMSAAQASGGGNITIGDIHVNVSGADNPREIANEVAEEILQAIKQTSYTEIFSS